MSRRAANASSMCGRNPQSVCLVDEPGHDKIACAVNADKKIKLPLSSSNLGNADVEEQSVIASKDPSAKVEIACDGMNDPKKFVLLTCLPHDLGLVKDVGDLADFDVAIVIANRKTLR